MEERAKQLGEEKISVLLRRFSVPAIVGMLVNALYNVVDRAFVGNAGGTLGGENGIAGITIAFPIALIMMAFMMLIGLGGNSLVSIKLGEGKKEEAEHILGNAFILLILVSLGVTVLGLIFLDPMLIAFGASPKVLPYARAFMQVILLGTVFQGVGFGMNNFIRGEGNPKIAMLTMLLGAFLNAALCPVFIFGLGLGVRGSAIATIIAQAISAAWVLRYFVSGKSTLKLRRQNLRLNGTVARQIVALGSAPFLLQLGASLVNVILNKSLQFYGSDTAITGMGIVGSIINLVLMPIFGINQGVQPIIGYNYGAKKYDRVREALKLAILSATAIVVAGFVMVEVFPTPIVHIFNRKNPELIDFTVYAMRTFLIFLPMIGFQIISSNYFQASGKPKISALLSLSRQLLFLIPLVLILPRYFGLHGVIWAGPAADLLSSLLTGVLILRELRHLEDRHNESMQPAAE